MALQISTAHKTALAPVFKALYDGAVIRVFSGTKPATADAAEMGTLLGIATLNGTPNAGLVFDVSGPYVTKPILASWIMTAIANGTPAWFRIAFPADSGGDSYTDLRVDGTIGPAPGDGVQLVWPSAVVNGNVYPVDTFLYTIPPIIGV